MALARWSLVAPGGSTFALTVLTAIPVSFRLRAGYVLVDVTAPLTEPTLLATGCLCLASTCSGEITLPETFLAALDAVCGAAVFRGLLTGVAFGAADGLGFTVFFFTEGPGLPALVVTLAPSILLVPPRFFLGP